MHFEKVRCTESLVEEFGLPLGLLQNKHRNPVGRTVVCSLEGKVVLISNPLHYSCYPDQDFTLVIDGECFPVWEKPKSEKRPHQVEVYVRKETERFDDAKLKGIARRAFASLRGVGEDVYETPIEIRGRTPQPPAARAPQEVIDFLNEFTSLAPMFGADIFWSIAVKSFVPALLRPDEVNAFVEYGEETRWSGLTPEARKRFGEVLKQLASEPRPR